MNFIEFSWILINCGFYGNQRNSGLALYLKMFVLVTSISVPNFMLISKSAQFTWNFELIAAGLDEEDDNMKPWRWKADMVIHTYCCWIVTNSPHVNAENCNGCMYNAISKILWDGFVSHYIVLQMRWNELKYGFYRQNPAYFPWIYFWILDKYSPNRFK